MMRNRSAGNLARGALVGFGFFAMGNHGATCQQDHGPGDHGAGPVKTLRGFGNSIGAGYAGANPFPRQRDSYFIYYGQEAAADRGWQIDYFGVFDSGEHTGPLQGGDLGIGSNGSIYFHMTDNPSYVSNADIVTVEAGGNDFLYARDQFVGNCNLGTLDARIDRWRQDWDLVVNYLAQNRNPQGITRGMSIYYPDPNNDGRDGTGPQCDGQFVYDILLPRLLSAGDYTCSTLEANGFRCADGFAVMNCDEDPNGNPDFACPNKRVLQALADSGTCPRVAPPQNSVYQYPVMDPNCIAANIDFSAFQDPSSVNKGGVNRDFILSDDTHPSDAGHRALGTAQTNLGFEDYLGDDNGPSGENSYQACVDNADNDDDGQYDCDDPDCANFCQ